MFYYGDTEFFTPPRVFSPEALRRLSFLCQTLRQLEDLNPRARHHVTGQLEALASEGELVEGALRFHILHTAKEFRATRHERGRGARARQRLQSLWRLLREALAREEERPLPQGEVPGLSLREALQDGIRVLNQEGRPGGMSLTRVDPNLWGPAPGDALGESEGEETDEEQLRERAQHKLELRVALREVESQNQEPEGLDYYGQPCFAFLQGQCDDSSTDCPFFHPTGLAGEIFYGSLPLEARPGDWRCLHCGRINRHFRRRCVVCPSEKPQFRLADLAAWDREAVRREELIRNNPRRIALRSQFGYDPNQLVETCDFWAHFFQTHTIDAWLKARRDLFPRRTRSTAPSSLHFTPTLVCSPSFFPPLEGAPCLAWIHRELSHPEKGEEEPLLSAYLIRILHTLETLGSGDTLKGKKWVGILLRDFVRMAFHLYRRASLTLEGELNKKRTHPSVAFLQRLMHLLDSDVGVKIPFPGGNRWEIKAALGFCTTEDEIGSIVPKVPRPKGW